NIKPKVTYVVVVKRHNTRFLTVNRNESSRSFNVPAGLVVDTTITDSTKFDFFLCSHHGLLGTSRPSRYFVLLNENNYDANAIQNITFYMCFLNPRATKSGSIPAPIVMADLSAGRARKHIVEAIDADASLSSLSTESDEDRTEEERKAYIERLNHLVSANRNIEDSLYYI
ncbi:Protein argonaute-2-like protein, partial [Leptotrombidium deliense]